MNVSLPYPYARTHCSAFARGRFPSFPLHPFKTPKIGLSSSSSLFRFPFAFPHGETRFRRRNVSTLSKSFPFPSLLQLTRASLQ